MSDGTEWITALLPLARDLFNKITAGQKVTHQEQTFALLFALTESTSDTRQQLVLMQKGLNDLTHSVNELCSAINHVAMDTSYIKGRLSAE